MKTSILVVDDDLAIARLVCAVLEKAGYAARHAEDADSAYALLKNESFDLLISDIEMGGISGIELVELLKRDPSTAELPVIMLTVRREESFKLQSFAGGADDYLCKPFSPKELVARIEALLRRVRNHGQVAGSTLKAGEIRADVDQRRAFAADQPIDLTPAEFEILCLLLRRPGNVLTYRGIIDSLSSGLRDMTSGTLYGHVKNLRKKLGSHGKLIETVYGTGYRLSP